MSSLSTYYHTQRGPLCLLVYALAGGFYLAAWYARNAFAGPDQSLWFTAAGVLLTVTAAGFHHLTVADEIDRLRIRFGPLSLFQRTVLYEEILNAEVGRTTVLDGWGIHLSLRGGWVWNLWGRDCVVLQLRKGTLRIGTDDAENLTAFIKSRLVNEED